MRISFAASTGIAMDISIQLRKTGKVTRRQLGVQVQELTVDPATFFGLKEAKGSPFAAVEKGVPANRAGIQADAVTLSVDGKPVENSGDFARLVGSTRPGTTVSAKVWRKAAPVQSNVTVDELQGQAG